jgi:ferredoxin
MKELKRTIIKIDEEKCTGCGLCVPSCVEGALQIVNGKAKVVSDRFCDGLGACIGKCPVGALTAEVREAKGFDEDAAQEHVKETQASFPNPEEKKKPGEIALRIDSMLSQWPIQLSLVPPNADFLRNADLIIAADCVGFAYANFHMDFLNGRKLIIGCPKLEDAQFYLKKLKLMLKELEPRSVTVVNMEIPCCFGLYRIVKEAIASTGRSIPLKQETIDLKGKRVNSKQE